VYDENNLIKSGSYQLTLQASRHHPADTHDYDHFTAPDKELNTDRYMDRKYVDRSIK
jgi:hypothetical protein